MKTNEEQQLVYIQRISFKYFDDNGQISMVDRLWTKGGQIVDKKQAKRIFKKTKNIENKLLIYFYNQIEKTLFNQVVFFQKKFNIFRLRKY